MASANDFIIDFRIEGSGQKDLDKISKSFEGIVQQAGGGAGGGGKGLSGAVKGAGKDAHALQGTLGTVGVAAGAAAAGVMAIAEGLERAMGFGVGLMKLGSGGFGMLGKGMEKLVHKGAEFETMLLRIQGAGKSESEAQKIMKSALALTAELPFTEADAVRMATTLSTVHIDATKGIGDMTYEALAKQGKIVDSLAKNAEFMQGAGKTKKITPLEIFGDYLSTIGELGTGYQSMAIHELTQYVEYGMTQSQKTFGLFRHELQKGEEKFKKLNNQEAGQKRMELLMEILGKRGALGLSKAASETHGGVMTMYKGLLDKITVAVMEPGKAGGAMTMLNKGMLSLYRLIADYFDETTEKGQKFLHQIKEMVSFITGTMVEGMKLLGRTLAKVFDFVSHNAGLMKFGAILLTVGSGLLVVGGAAITFGAALGMAALAGTVLTVVMVGLANLVGLVFLPLILGAAAGVAAITAGVYLAVAAFDSLGATWKDASIMLSALIEAFSTWNEGNAELAEETAAALEEAGLVQFFNNIIVGARTAELYVKGFAEGFAASFKWSTGGVQESFERLWNRITDIFSILTGQMTAYGAEVDGTAKKGKSFGDAVGQAFGMVAKALGFMIDGVVLFSNVLGPVVQVASVLYAMLGLVLNVIEIIGDVVIGGLVLGFQEIYYFVQIIGNSLMAIVQATMAMANKEPAKAMEIMAANAEKTATALGDAEKARSAFTSRIKGDANDISEVMEKADRSFKIGGRMSNLTTENAYERKKSIERTEAPYSELTTEEMMRNIGEGRQTTPEVNPNIYQLKPLPPPPVPSTPGAGAHGAEGGKGVKQPVTIHNKMDVKLEVGGEQFGRAVVDAVKDHADMLGIHPVGGAH